MKTSFKTADVVMPDLPYFPVETTEAYDSSEEATSVDFETDSDYRENTERYTEQHTEKATNPPAIEHEETTRPRTTSSDKKEVVTTKKEQNKATTKAGNHVVNNAENNTYNQQNYYQYYSEYNEYSAIETNTAVVPYDNEVYATVGEYEMSEAYTSYDAGNDTSITGQAAEGRSAFPMLWLVLVVVLVVAAVATVIALVVNDGKKKKQQAMNNQGYQYPNNQQGYQNYNQNQPYSNGQNNGSNNPNYPGQQ